MRPPERPCPWLPGGHAEADEPPHVAVRRLIGAQLGLDLPITGADLALVDYSPATPSRGEREGYNFVFARTLTPAQAGTARPLLGAGPELRGFDWLTVRELATRCREYHVRRITQAFTWQESAGSAPLMIAGALAH